MRKKVSFEQYRSAVEQEGFEFSVRPCHALYSDGSSEKVIYNVTMTYHAPESGVTSVHEFVLDTLDDFRHAYTRHFGKVFRDYREDAEYKNALYRAIKNIDLLEGKI